MIIVICEMYMVMCDLVSTDAMALSLLELSFFRSAVLATYFSILLSNGLGVVQYAGAQGNPPVVSPTSAPVPAPTPGPVYVDPTCQDHEIKFQAYEEDAMLKLLKAWNRSDPTSGRFNITSWKESVHPCDRSSKDSGWRGVRCSGVLVSHNDTNVTVCEMLIVGLGVEDRGITGELIPEIGNLRNLQYIYLRNNPGLTGPIPDTIWNLPNLKEIRFVNNSLNGSVLLNSSIKSIALERIDLSYNFFTSWRLDLPLWNLQYLNLSNNLLSGAFTWGDFSVRTAPGSYYTKVDTLDLSNNRFDELRGSNQSYQYNLPSLRTLYLSNNSLGGAFDTKIVQTSAIQSVYFDSNRFNGTLALPLIPFENSSLNTISLTDNSITDIEYPNETTESTLSASHLQFASILFLGGNPLCNTHRQTEPLPVLCRHNRTSQVMRDITETTNTRKILIAAIIPAVFLMIVIFILAFLYLKNRRSHKYLLLGVQQKFAEHELKPTLFSYSELQKATRDFHADMKLGEGAFGAVYKGQLPDGTEVAVKQLFNTTQQSMDEFLNEVVLLTGIKHRNLVKLKGCCLRGDRRLLVYEYVENSDLADILFGHKGIKAGDPILSWPQRFNICLGVAQGLHYLHALVDPKIIHRDIKASNILLDKKMEAKIADFGMALLFPTDESHVMTIHVAGTRGYLAPEYASLGQLSEKADVWSFGVLVLEVVAGRSNIDGSLTPEKTYLAAWAWRMHEEDTLMDLLDPTLSLQNDEEARQVQRFIVVALSCLQPVVEKRPTMAQVLTMLQDDMEIPLLSAGTSYQVSEIGAYSQQSTSQVTLLQSIDHPLRSEDLPLQGSDQSTKFSELQAR
ncbi:hypothetical protein M758_11G129500 [Ceratodon purpureus]|nr:hypothetical protein M758_11G129500 [Ceratodon purpureus]